MNELHSENTLSEGLHIVSLGGSGIVTLNMYLYVYDQEILIVDCGIGFPDIQMPGADILIPDTSYLHELIEKEGKKVVGLLLTHGHDDHIAATPYVLPEFDKPFPVYGSPLTIEFAKDRMSESAANPETIVLEDKRWVKIGTHFEIFPVGLPHSVPDTKHFFIRTPEGTIYHGTDFKLDKDPIDSKLVDETTIREMAAQENVLCMLVDSLGVEKSEWVPSESTVGPALEEEILSTRGKCLVTLMSSHIHRIQQTIYAAQKAGRKIVFVGRSVEQNVAAAQRLNMIHIPQGMLIDKHDLGDYGDSELCIIIAGSQGQEGSSLVRAVFGEHRDIQITKSDKVIFSADAIPGNQIYYFKAIDELCRNGIEVVYPGINRNLHQSGHGSRLEQQHLVQLVQPDYIMPIGGEDRMRVKFIEFVAAPLDIMPERVLIPMFGEIITFRRRKPYTDHTVQIFSRIVGGLGIGDVGPRVLSDRMALSQAGIIVVLIPRTKNDYDLQHIQIISRGFVFMKQAEEVIQFIKNETAEVIRQSDVSLKESKLKIAIERKLAKKLYKTIQRQPIIVAEFI